jgi:hypothetical protein
VNVGDYCPSRRCALAIGEPHATRLSTRYGAAWLGLALYDRYLPAFGCKMNRGSQTIVARTHHNRIEVILSTPFIQVIGKRRAQANAKISSPFDSPTEW